MACNDLLKFKDIVQVFPITLFITKWSLFSDFFSVNRYIYFNANRSKRKIHLLKQTKKRVIVFWILVIYKDE